MFLLLLLLLFVFCFLDEELLSIIKLTKCQLNPSHLIQANKGLCSNLIFKKSMLAQFGPGSQRNNVKIITN